MNTRLKTERLMKVVFINNHAAFFHGCNGGGSKPGVGGGSSGSKYQSARYRKMPGNAALKSVPKTQTTRSFDDGSSKCFASPPQTPAIWWSSCERHSFIIFHWEGRRVGDPLFWGRRHAIPPNFDTARCGDRALPVICPYHHPCSSPFSARGPVPAISQTSRRSGFPAPAATG